MASTSMNERDRHILEVFAARTRAEFPDAQVWAYGSRARGDAQGDSDYDMCVVVNDLSEGIEDRIGNIAFEVGWDLEVLITTVAYRRDQFEHGLFSVSPLVLNIRREGVLA